jgi:hypothetical protein
MIARQRAGVFVRWHNLEVPDLDDMPRSTLRVVLEQLGALALAHDADEGQLDTPVQGVVIDDRAFGAPVSPGCAVLGVGTSTDEELAALVDRAADGGAVAVFVKRPGGLHRSGPGRPVPVVEVAADLGWEQLHAFVRTALLRVGEARPGGPQTLFDVANAVAVLVDGAVVIEDEHLRVIAYSSLHHEIDDARRATILGRVIPDRYVGEMRHAGITTHLDSSADPVRFDLEGQGLLPRLVIALRSGGRSVGLLWAITDDAREANARRVMADAAPDVAAELVRHLTADVSRATDRLSAAQQVLDGRAVPGLRALLGAEPTAGFVALALLPTLGAAPSPSTTDPGDLDPVGRTAQFATVYIDAYRVPALVAAPAGGQVDLVVGLDAHTTVARARELLDELCERTRATFDIDLLGAMGTPVAEVRGVPGSRRDATAVLEVLAEDGVGSRTASYEEVQSRVALRELARSIEGAEHLGRGPIPRLLASGSKQDAALVATVRAYLDTGGDVGRAAALLGVHRNTVRYRVSRFEAITGLALDDPAARLVAQVQLFVRRP